MLTNQNFTALLKNQIQEEPIPSFILTGELPSPSNDYGLIMEFPEFHFAELSIDLDEYKLPKSLTLSFSISEEDTEEINNFLLDFLDNHGHITLILRDYLFSIFSEITNSDACSYNATFDTNHGIMPGEGTDGTWTLTVAITDHLS